MKILRIGAIMFAVIISVITIAIGFNGALKFIRPLALHEIVSWGCALMVLALIWGLILQEPESKPKKNPVYRVRHMRQIGRINGRAFFREVIQVKKEEES